MTYDGLTDSTAARAARDESFRTGFAKAARKAAHQKRALQEAKLAKLKACCAFDFGHQSPIQQHDDNLFLASITLSNVRLRAATSWFVEAFSFKYENCCATASNLRSADGGNNNPNNNRGK